MKLKENEDYYINSDGKLIFTKEYHFRRGTCCGNGCVNCTYGWINVKEPKKTELLNKKL